MRAKVTIELDTSTGDYTTQFSNISKPGEDIDYHQIMEVLKKIFGDIDGQVIAAKEDDDRILKSVH